MGHREERFFTTSAKCLSDSESDSGISNVTQGMLSLGHKNTHIHTAIGSEDKVIHEMKISLLDNHSVVQMSRPREKTRVLVQKSSKKSGGIIRPSNSLEYPLISITYLTSPKKRESISS